MIWLVKLNYRKKSNNKSLNIGKELTIKLKNRKFDFTFHYLY